jgi:hypothetical protein
MPTYERADTTTVNTCRRLVHAVLAALVIAVGVVASPEARVADAYPGAPWFEPGKPYSANFPDPSIMRVGNTYYAYATATGGAYLPVMSSTDLQTWIARPAYNPGPPLNSDPYFNDALPRPASWAYDRPVGGRLTKEIWAPGVERFGNTYVAFYTTRLGSNPNKFCISYATSSSPLGPFVDNTSGPLHCDADPKGSIDPEPFIDADGSAWLLWKSEGVPGSMPTRIWSRRLNANGIGFVPGSSQHELLRTTAGWEGNVIENPSMVRHDGHLYLFYSANEHLSADYAIGYAECASPAGGCAKRTQDAPLLGNRWVVIGPGGPSAFVDAQGNLQMAYHWWNYPYTNYPPYPQCVGQGSCTTQGQRRLAVEPVHRAADGRLQVGGTPPPLDTWVGMASQPTGSQGYVVASSRGRAETFGALTDRGDLTGTSLARPVVGAAVTPSGGGYFMVATDGGIFTFGDARFRGSTGGMHLNRPIVGMAPTPTGNGYWLVASDGGIFTFGDARFRGSTGGMHLNRPIVGMAPTPTGDGYWFVASDGGIFTFGDAAFHGRP